MSVFMPCFRRLTGDLSGATAQDHGRIWVHSIIPPPPSDETVKAGSDHQTTGIFWPFVGG